HVLHVLVSDARQDSLLDRVELLTEAAVSLLVGQGMWITCHGLPKVDLGVWITCHGLPKVDLVAGIGRSAHTGARAGLFGEHVASYATGARDGAHLHVVAAFITVTVRTVKVGGSEFW